MKENWLVQSIVVPQITPVPPYSLLINSTSPPLTADNAKVTGSIPLMATMTSMD